MRRIPVTSMLFAALALAACGQKQDQQVEQPQAAAEDSACAPQVLSDIQITEIAPGLTSRTLVAGCGDVAAKGNVVAVHYTGWLYDSDVADNIVFAAATSYSVPNTNTIPVPAGPVSGCPLPAIMCESFVTTVTA